MVEQEKKEYKRKNRSKITKAPGWSELPKYKKTWKVNPKCKKEFLNLVSDVHNETKFKEWVESGK